jgi:hypothetical protein
MPQTEMELRDWQDVIESNAAQAARELMLTAAHKPDQEVYETKVEVVDGPYKGMVITAKFSREEG